MVPTEDSVAGHYGGADISARILEALGRAGVDLERLERRDLTPFDEFHGGGIASTRDLAAFAGLQAGMHVLDVGSGIGGPARTLADEFGCRVSGIDLTTEFVAAAVMLTEKLGMECRCDFRQGSATALPYPDDHFDAVWSQNMMMNVADKSTFFSEVARVLKPGGSFAFEAVLEGNGEPLHLPTFWASSADMNFLVTREALEDLLETAGLARVKLEDTTAAVIAQGHKRKAALSRPRPQQLNISVIVPDEVEDKMSHALMNNEQGRTRTIKGVYRKAE